MYMYIIISKNYNQPKYLSIRRIREMIKNLYNKFHTSKQIYVIKFSYTITLDF